jgi:hypothetical protein
MEFMEVSATVVTLPTLANFKAQVDKYVKSVSTLSKKDAEIGHIDICLSYLDLPGYVTDEAIGYVNYVEKLYKQRISML